MDVTIYLDLIDKFTKKGGDGRNQIYDSKEAKQHYLQAVWETCELPKPLQGQEGHSILNMRKEQLQEQWDILEDMTQSALLANKNKVFPRNMTYGLAVKLMQKLAKNRDMTLEDKKTIVKNIITRCSMDDPDFLGKPDAFGETAVEIEPWSYVTHEEDANAPKLNANFIKSSFGEDFFDDCYANEKLTFEPYGHMIATHEPKGNQVD